MPDGQGRTFEVCPIPRLEQLFANLCDQWQAKNLEAEAHLRLDEVAGAHAAGQVPQESRARQSADPEGNPQYFIRVFGAGERQLERRAVSRSKRVLPSAAFIENEIRRRPNIIR